MSSSATRTGPRSASALKASRTASPIACGSGGSASGSTRSRAISSARRRGGSSEAATSSKTGPSRSDSPANESDASASLPLPTRALPRQSPALIDAGLPENRLADPRFAGQHQRAGSPLDSREERPDLDEFLVATDDRRAHASIASSTCRRAGGELGAAHAELAVDVGKVGLDRAHAHEELGGDLLVGAALGGKFGDPPFGLGQLLGGGCAAADPRQLGAGLLRPESGAELVEDRKRLLERLPRGPLLLRLPAHGAEAEQRTAALERVRMGVELGECAVERLEGGGRVSLGSGEQAATPRGCRHRPGAPQPSPVPLVRFEVARAPLELAQRDQCLDCIGPNRLRRVVHAALEQLSGRSRR